MALIEMSWKPSDRQLRQFGWACLIGLPLLGWVFGGRPRIGSISTGQTVAISVLAALGLIAAAVGTIAPQRLRRVFVSACLATFPIGFVVGHVVMMAMYYVVMTPVALAFRIVGRDALELKMNPSAASFWKPKSLPTDPRRYFRQS